ncbi:MAG: Cdc6/Cdc18 family protein [Conexivisphaera sp.]
MSSTPVEGVGAGGSRRDVLDEIFNRVITSSSIFLNRDVLRNDYVPDHILFRDNEISQLGQMLAPLLRGNKPSNIFLYGKTGTGKTVVARYVMRKMNEKFRELGLNSTFIYVNTRLASTQYKVLVDLGSQLDVSIPFTGLSLSEASSRIFERIRRDGRNVVVILDEIDYIVKNFGDDMLYEFTRVNNQLSGNFITIMGISNDLKFKEYLDPRVLSSLSEEEVVFPPYTVEELEAILRDRAAAAFRPGAVSDSAIRLCASLAASEHGDARRAVDLLRVAGELAEREGSDEVTADHVSRASRSIERDRTYEVIRSLPLHGKLILAAVLATPEEANTGRLYSNYVAIARRLGVEPLTQRRVSGILSELDVLGVVNAPVVSSGRFGRSKRIKLAVPRDAVMRALGEDELVSSILRRAAAPSRGRPSWTGPRRRQPGPWVPSASSRTASRGGARCPP